MSKTRRLIVSTAALASLAFVSPANAAGTPVIVSGPGSTQSTYTQPVAFAQQGDAITYVNADIATHDVTSFEMGPATAAHCVEDFDPFTPGTQERFPPGPNGESRCPLIYSELIGAARTTPVRGLENVGTAARIIDFYCSIHRGMTGKLVVLPTV